MASPKNMKNNPNQRTAVVSPPLGNKMEKETKNFKSPISKIPPKINNNQKKMS